MVLQLVEEGHDPWAYIDQVNAKRLHAPSSGDATCFKEAMGFRNVDIALSVCSGLRIEPDTYVASLSVVRPCVCL